MPRWPRFEADHPEKWEPKETQFTWHDHIITATATYVGFDEGPTRSAWSDTSHDRVTWHPTKWTVLVVEDGYKIIETPFSQGSAYEKPPTAETVLWSLASDALCGDYETSEEFASSLGYDEDSRTAERTYQACRNIALRMRQVFGNEYDALIEWGTEQ